jgi:ribosomal protein S12 methylthiotransferase accessory factor
VTAKTYTRGTHRIRPPAETFRAVEPLLGRFGITRVANITGLDHIGIPVWQAVRPNGRALAVSQGKGLDAASAKTSAVMESIESWHAEYALPPVRLESHAVLASQAAVLDPERLPRLRGGPYHRQAIIPWVQAVDLLSGGPVWVPFELVHLMFVVPEPPGTGCFLRSSNGLASGNTFAEAAAHALAEVIERDGVALAQGLRPAALERRRVDLATVDEPAAAELIARLVKAGIAVTVHDLTSDIGVPIFRAVIFDRATDNLLNPSLPARGEGCHPDAGVALCRALTEAAQSRLTFIAGARDDLSRGQYRWLQSRTTLTRERRAARDRAPGPRRFSDVRGCATSTVEGDLEAMLARLRRARIAHVASVELTGPGLPFSVVRVVVPGLEAEAAGPVAGGRARRRRA